MWHAVALSTATRGCHSRHRLVCKSFPPCRWLLGGDRVRPRAAGVVWTEQPEGAQERRENGAEWLLGEDQPLDTLHGGAAPPDQGQLGRRALEGASQPLGSWPCSVCDGAGDNTTGSSPGISGASVLHVLLSPHAHVRTKHGWLLPSIPRELTKPKAPMSSGRGGVRRPWEKPVARGTKEGRVMFWSSAEGRVVGKPGAGRGAVV